MYVKTILKPYKQANGKDLQQFQVTIEPAVDCNRISQSGWQSHISRGIWKANRIRANLILTPRSKEGKSEDQPFLDLHHVSMLPSKALFAQLKGNVAFGFFHLADVG